MVAESRVNVYFPQVKFEIGSSIRQVFDIGMGFNWQGTMKPSDIEEVNLLPIYFFSKINPFESFKFRPYTILQCGLGFAWGRYGEEIRALPLPYFHFGGGFGIEYNRNFYVEYISTFSFLVMLPNERIAYDSIGLSIGYRFDF